MAAAAADPAAGGGGMADITNNPEHPFWRACGRLLASSQEQPQPPANASTASAAASAALAQAARAGRQEAASEALATLLLEGGDSVLARVEREFRPGAFFGVAWLGGWVGV